MVLFYISKLVNLIHIIGNCFVGVPSRNKRICEDYETLTANSIEEVSVRVSPFFEKVKEINIDKYDIETRRSILSDLIGVYTLAELKIPSDLTKYYLVTQISKCDSCQAASTLLVIKPGRKGLSAIVYTRTGPRILEFYHKNCPNCSAVYYYNYKEANNVRIYYEDEPKYFSTTQETVFEAQLLDEITEDIFLCETHFSNFVTKYNRLHVKNGEPKLVRQRLLNCWMIYAISKRINVSFQIKRKIDRNLDTESIFKELYPALKN